jgi:hypothetical protein
MRRRITALLALAAVTTLAACAQANGDEGTRVLGHEDYHGVMIENTDGGPIDIHYEVTVDSGPAVSVFFMDDADYADVQNGSGFEYYIVYSVEDTRHARREWTWSEEGVFYVVVINLDGSLENATVTYSIGHEETPTEGDTVLWVAAAVIVVVVAVVATLLLAGRRNGGKVAPGQVEGGERVVPRAEVRPPPGPYPPPPPLGPYPPPPGG